MSHRAWSAKNPANTTWAHTLYHKTQPQTDSRSTKRIQGGLTSSHGGEVGFALAHDIYFGSSLLNVRKGDTVVDLGGGRGGPSIMCKLIEKGARVISVELEQERHNEAMKWWQRIEDGGTCSASPEFLNCSFLHLNEQILSSPRLRLFFNNFNMVFALDGENTQRKLEEKLSKLCKEGTIVVSTGEMFMARSDAPFWKLEKFKSPVSSADIDWLTGASHHFSIYKYSRRDEETLQQNPEPCANHSVSMRTSARSTKKVRTADLNLGLMSLVGTHWEHNYGKQCYPVKLQDNSKVQFMVEEPWSGTGDGIFENYPQSEPPEKVESVYSNGRFNAAPFFGSIQQAYTAMQTEQETLSPRKRRKIIDTVSDAQNAFRRWLFIFVEMSLHSRGECELLKQSCSYVRPARHLLYALAGLESTSIFEFGAGKGVLFFLLKMLRKMEGYNVSCDKALDCEHTVTDWVTFQDKEFKALKDLGIVKYEDFDDQPNLEFFEHLFTEWKRGVSSIDNAHTLTPPMLLIAWPNTDNMVFTNCIQGWYNAGGERLALIYDPTDEQAFVSGAKVPGDNWCIMRQVLNDTEGGIVRYDKHMPLNPWGALCSDFYHAANHSYGLYIFCRNKVKEAPRPNSHQRVVTRSFGQMKGLKN